MIRWMALLLACGLLGAAAARAAETRDPYQHFFNLNTGDLREEIADARGSGKKAIFFMFEQEGCPGCIYMKGNVLNQRPVQDFYRERFFNFAVDVNGALRIRDLRGRDLTEKSFAQSLGIRGTPTLVFYDLDGAEIIRIAGPIRDVDEFMLLGEFVASGAYKTRQFADFKHSRRAGKGG